MMKQITMYKTCKTVGKTFSNTEFAKENASDMAWPGGQKFSKNFSTIAEIFRGENFFLTGP